MTPEGTARLDDTSGAAPAPAAPGERRRVPAELEKLLRGMAKHDASDLHLKVGAPPMLRVSGKLRPIEAPPYTREAIDALVRDALGPAQAEAYAACRDVDFALSLEGVGRYRINIFRQRGSVSAAIRRVRTQVPTFEDLGLPAETMRRIAGGAQGLVLVCGVTGSGKSTTLAAMIEHVNETRRCHIVTIEDPIEYLYRDKKAFINQREVGIDVEDFRTALKYVVRQDPDVILIGEMRDQETFEAALAAAETGHLVFGTLHSSTVPATIGRILDLFPAAREKQVRQSLRFNLRAIICQKLLPSLRRTPPVVPALEILIGTPTVKKLIADGEDQALETVVRGGAEDGMTDFNSSLLRLVQSGAVSEQTALEASANPDQLKLNLKGIFLGDDKKILGA
jgi:twitching motility protein PilT